MATKTSAVADEPIEVLFALHPNFNITDFAGPLEVFATANYENDKSTTAFECTVAAAEPKVMSEQGVFIGSQISYKEAHERLNDFDVLVVVGGGTDAVIKSEAEPLQLIDAYSELQQKDTIRERTLLSICTGSLFLAKQGILAGLSATTHPDFLTTFENLCSKSAQKTLGERTDVIESARYVVNNLRFDIGDEDENPYIRRTSDAGRRPSNARKGSISFQGSGRRESVARRAAMRLGGLRVVTSGGVSAGIDAALYMVSALISEESATEVARVMQWNWVKGVVVDGLDV
ncbi:Isonitrile hydratase-like protein xanA like [Verticillium longisporum]|uniref:Isonitrile hydratase-like protein xanA like n=2 Tax=Verticillium TaxID=1036719 RepID=A0A0G4ND36_VERLO|nr:hypothetical protein VdG1_01858 [Verticillium dahliae VDG1]KAG7135274.1 Isonitrile hydratase-like protein xanA like [Verticillium longisporum]PNH43674.1 hypothetical protein VD0004_g3819 [Verticillium dahliae]PNH73817.1 hypothetical protein VD0001_g3746 [Verticillium dahliae]RBQ97687.1 hypothetical protein VDGD_00509 [Verticillium dahliae]